MGSNFYIMGGHPLPRGVDALSGALEELLGPAGEVTGITGTSGDSRSWQIDLELADDEEPRLEEWVGRVAGFLRGWAVPLGTWIQVVPPDYGETGRGSREVKVFPD